MTDDESLYDLLAYSGSGCRDGLTHAMRWSPRETNEAELRYRVIEIVCGQHSQCPSPYHNKQIEDLLNVFNEFLERDHVIIAERLGLDKEMASL